MRLPSLLLTVPPLTLAADSSAAATPSFSLSNILFSTYWAFTSPSHLALNTGTIDFTITNSALDDNITCSGVNSNSWAVFYPSTVYPCVIPEEDEGKKKEVGGQYDPYCWATGASFTLDTTTFETRNLSVEMSWTCANEGTYRLTVWTLLNLDCEQWNCENDLWPVGDIFQKVTRTCKPLDVIFPSAEVAVTKMEK